MSIVCDALVKGSRITIVGAYDCPDYHEDQTEKKPYVCYLFDPGSSVFGTPYLIYDKYTSINETLAFVLAGEQRNYDGFAIMNASWRDIVVPGEHNVHFDYVPLGEYDDFTRESRAIHSSDKRLCLGYKPRVVKEYRDAHYILAPADGISSELIQKAVSNLGYTSLWEIPPEINQNIWLQKICQFHTEYKTYLEEREQQWKMEEEKAKKEEARKERQQNLCVLIVFIIVVLLLIRCC